MEQNLVVIHRKEGNYNRKNVIRITHSNTVYHLIAIHIVYMVNLDGETIFPCSYSKIHHKTQQFEDNPQERMLAEDTMWEEK